MQVLRFARDIEALTPMTTTKPEATAAIETLAARGDTARQVDLDAPGGQDSKTYTPEGDRGADGRGDPRRPRAACRSTPWPRSSPRFSARSAALRGGPDRRGRAQTRCATTPSPRSRAVVIDGHGRLRVHGLGDVQELKSFHDRDFIDVVQRNRLRDHLAAPLGDTCAGGDNPRQRRPLLRGPRLDL